MRERKQALIAVQHAEAGKRRETKVEDGDATPAIARAVVVIAGSRKAIAIPAAARIAPVKRAAEVDLGAEVQFNTRKGKIHQRTNTSVRNLVR